MPLYAREEAMRCERPGPDARDVSESRGGLVAARARRGGAPDPRAARSARKAGVGRYTSSERARPMHSELHLHVQERAPTGGYLRLRLPCVWSAQCQSREWLRASALRT